MIYISHMNLEDETIKYFINSFKENIMNTYVWDETRVLSLDRVDKGEFYYRVLETAKNVKSFVSNDERFSILQNVEIVKYPHGAHKNFHKDRTRKTTTGASITYLNDNYIGGQTIIEGVDVQPLSGRTVYFDGMEFRHAVSNIIKGDRYTLSMWYGLDESMPISKDFLRI
ncbi:hypothetical cyanophage protein [Synechococcus phage S-RSM4]|uniref:Hypothetical cyanophage protein n=1 Tax=Synechococcus phage S-RSM4 TaxID=555387 RepID=C7BVA7_9CAUD|nr:DNA endonuclease [Synechococcus phage S-RSM4]CAR63336.1 hypothetical cyanophage protein [Synechococcus phage S-RSM4]